MKKLIIIAVSLLCLSAHAQQIDPQVPNEKSPSFYCAKLKDGMLVLVSEGKEVLTDVILANGSKITMDCTLIKADGSNVKLQDGECVSPEGVIVNQSKPGIQPKRREKGKGK